MKYEDVPSAQTFSKQLAEVYSEGTEVGYRYYNKHNIAVRCPFGYGLSYTTFTRTEWAKKGEKYVQTITNTGDRFGGEVAQLYIDGELRGFKKVYLEPGESVTVEIVPAPVDDKKYSETYTVPEAPETLPVTMESRLVDLRQTFMGRILFNAILSVAGKQEKAARKLPDGPEKDNMMKNARFLRRTLENVSLRFLSMTAGRRTPYNTAQAFVELTNGHLIRGIGCFFKKIKVPKLPKEQ